MQSIGHLRRTIPPLAVSHRDSLLSHDERWHMSLQNVPPPLLWTNPHLKSVQNMERSEKMVREDVLAIVVIACVGRWVDCLYLKVSLRYASSIQNNPHLQWPNSHPQKNPKIPSTWRDPPHPLLGTTNNEKLREKWSSIRDGVNSR